MAVGRTDEDGRRCPWCGSTAVSTRRRWPRGWAWLWIIFPPAWPLLLAEAFGRPPDCSCRRCGMRWERGLRLPPPAPARFEDLPGATAWPGLVRHRPETPTAPAPPSREVRLVASPGACRTCRTAAGVYDADKAPTLPIAGCTCPEGCRCTLVPLEPTSPTDPPGEEADRGRASLSADPLPRDPWAASTRLTHRRRRLGDHRHRG